MLDPEHSRTVVFVRGQKGNWTVTPAAGSPALATSVTPTSCPSRR